MTSRTHDAFAFASLITVAAFFPPEKLNVATLVISVIGADIGALIPDMDGGTDCGKCFLPEKSWGRY